MRKQTKGNSTLSIESTNSILRELAGRFPEGFIFVANARASVDDGADPDDNGMRQVKVDTNIFDRPDTLGLLVNDGITVLRKHYREIGDEDEHDYVAA